MNSKKYLFKVNVDNSIVKFARENPEIIIATLDKEMRKK